MQRLCWSYSGACKKRTVLLSDIQFLTALRKFHGWKERYWCEERLSPLRIPQVNDKDFRKSSDAHKFIQLFLLSLSKYRRTFFCVARAACRSAVDSVRLNRRYCRIVRIRLYPASRAGCFTWIVKVWVAAVFADTIASWRPWSPWIWP